MSITEEQRKKALELVQPCELSLRGSRARDAIKVILRGQPEEYSSGWNSIHAALRRLLSDEGGTFQDE